MDVWECACPAPAPPHPHPLLQPLPCPCFSGIPLSCTQGCPGCCPSSSLAWHPLSPPLLRVTDSPVSLWCHATRCPCVVTHPCASLLSAKLIPTHSHSRRASVDCSNQLQKVLCSAREEVSKVPSLQWHQGAEIWGMPGGAGDFRSGVPQPACAQVGISPTPMKR